MLPFGCLAFVAVRVYFAEDRSERFSEVWAQLFVVGDVQAPVERLVRQPPVGVAGVRVGAVRVGEQAQTVVQERPGSRMFLVVLTETLLDISDARADAVLMPVERRQVDCVGDVRGEELV